VLVVHGATHDPPYSIFNETSSKVFGKKRVSNHGLVKLANSTCINVKKRFQEPEEKLFGMPVRSKARSKHSATSKHYEIEIDLGSMQTCNASCTSWHERLCLRDSTVWMRIHQPRKIYKNISTTLKKLRTYGKLLSQEQKEQGSHMKFYYHVWMIAIKR
jgi:hypothetical protein